MQSQRAWMTLAVLSAISSIMIGGPLVSLTVYIPVLERAEGWSHAALGGAATVLLVSLSLASMLSGALCDRSSSRLTILTGGILVAGGCLIAARMDHAGGFSGAYFAIGAGLGLATIVPSISVISRVFPDRRGLAIGVYFSSLALMSAVFPSLSGALAGLLGWRTAMALTGVLVACTLPLLCFVGEGARARPPPSADADDTRPGMQVSRALLLPQYWMLLVAMTLALINAQGVLFAIVSFLVQGGMTLKTATAIYGIANLCAAPAMIVAGMAADRWGAPRVLVSAAVLQGAGTLALLGIGAPATMGCLAAALFCLCWGMTSGVASQLGPVLLQDVVGMRHYGALLGINQAVVGLVSALSPLGTAVMRDAGFSQIRIFQYLALACLLVVPLIYLMPTVKRRNAAHGPRSSPLHRDG